VASLLLIYYVVLDDLLGSASFSLSFFFFNSAFLCSSASFSLYFSLSFVFNAFASTS